MPDDKTKVDEPDCSKVAKDQDCEARYVAEEFGSSTADALKLIEHFGNNRKKLYGCC